MINADQVLAELHAAFYDIPFENSDYQNRAFVLAAQHTPARGYRALGLRMFAKLRAVQELKYARERDAVFFDEKQAVIDDAFASVFDKRRAAIDIAEKRGQQAWQDKLLNDAIRELNCLYAEFQKYPRYTREQFELEEHVHFEQRLQAQIASGGNGSVESLQAMAALDNYQQLIEMAQHELSLPRNEQ
jgi:hypothetical protein